MTKNKIVFTWDIHLACNYRCPYCWFHGQWDQLKANNSYLPAKDLYKYWYKVYEKYGRVLITIAGGEPLIYPNVINVLEPISSLHDLEVTSNLSIETEELFKLTEKLKNRNVKISATFHPLFSKLSEFNEKVKHLAKNKQLGGVLYLAYPPQIKDIPRLRNNFKRIGLPFNVLTFWGHYKGKQYPENYTDSEKKTIGLSIGSRSGKDFQTSPKKTKGMLCNAGHTYGVIHADGKVLRCGGSGVRGKAVVIGDFYNPGFELLDAPAPCPSDVCPCNEWAFLLNEYLTKPRKTNNEIR